MTRNPKLCRVDKCAKDTSKGGQGYCGMHYQRVKRDGVPGPAKQWTFPGAPVRVRILARTIIQPDTGCWEWQGATTRGYGVIGDGDKLVYTHRWMYENQYGPMAENHVTDHTCVNPLCCNPAHLEAVTRAENNRRGGKTTGERSRAA